MGLFTRFFGQKGNQESLDSEQIKQDQISEWETLPAYVPASQEDYELVSAIATAIAAGDNPDSHFIVKNIFQRNKEAVKLSLITSSLVAGEAPDSQFLVKGIYRKK
ncbi:hypothetical protein N1496_07940 [Streptococcus didelphis]|uniref:Uncharacterized protein n=1 Tax=Streptococcus didelphis TaxID=102886 RepID=A0ABY9LGD2_9STRE|nr:hypothetical protein [Streptococcus didelphis]WMB27938.1 hypothetical protein N1496_07940 [Streptococcus didelphis]